MADTLSQKTKAQSADVPTTTDDHTALEQFKYGDTIRGTFVKSLKAWMRYIRDIEDAYGNEDDYYNGGILYIDTFKPIGPQLKKLK